MKSQNQVHDVRININGENLRHQIPLFVKGDSLANDCVY